jgi:hypothetical protein
VTRCYHYEVRLPATATDEEIIDAYLDHDPVEVAGETLDMRVERVAAGMRKE